MAAKYYVDVRLGKDRYGVNLKTGVVTQVKRLGLAGPGGGSALFDVEVTSASTVTKVVARALFPGAH